ncbi:MAG: hypothetical protein H6727_01570 [Myxococcales bacterium]|nr:hypothetical protein [Myxococcales bacterium]
MLLIQRFAQTLLLSAALSFMLLPFEAMAQKKRGGRVIRITDVKIVGRIQKPQAFYVLNRAPLNYEGFKRKESFVKKVINAVKKTPF